MPLTRQGSRLLASSPNRVNIPLPEMASAQIADPLGIGVNIAVTEASAFPTAVVTATTTTSSPAPLVSSDVSVSPEALNNTIISPNFASITAQNIRRELRQVIPGTAAFRLEADQGNNLQELVATIGLAQAQLMRSCEEIRQMSRDMSQSRAVNSVPQVLPVHATYLPPPPIAPPEIQRFIDEPIPIVPPPPIFGQPAARSQPPPQFSGPSGNTQPEPSIPSQPPMSVYPGYQSQLPYYGFSMSQVPSPKFVLKKWGVKFDGSDKTMDAEDFIFRVEALRQDHGLPFTDLVKDFQQLLEGEAHDWYWTHRRLAPFRSWPELRDAFLTQFRRFESEFQIQKKILDRRQQPQESFEDFFKAVVKLRNQQRSPYSEENLVEIMKGNLKSSLAALIFPVKIFGLNHFRQEVKRAESMLANQRQAYQQRSYQPPRVHEIAYEEEASGTDFEIDAINHSSRYTCWNCRQVGHSYVECPTPISRVFCFKCGREGVVTPKCPKCQGNVSRSVPRTGQARSTQTDSQ